MIESLSEDKVDYHSLKYLDIGAGSGYFVGALRDLGLNTYGIEISGRQVEYGNTMLGDNLLQCIAPKDVLDHIRTSDANVASFIGVLEHLTDMNEVIEAVSNNPSIRYMYFSVPMFSYAVAFEAINDNIYSRVLGGGHTHLFTDESLSYMYKKYGWSVISEWRFGMDASDLYRIMLMRLKCMGNDYLAEVFIEKYSPILDDIQLIMDQKRFSSETHVLVKKSI